MTFEAFNARAHELFEQIPADFKEGVDGLEVTRRTVLHPALPEVYTLGECLSEHYPSEFGGAAEIRSRVVLYYGSFLELSRIRDDWDWDEEIWETVTHEIRHHLEHLALDDSLGDLDRAEEHNFARREGDRFDPFFFRDGRRLEAGVYEVDGDVFVEVPIDARAGGSEPVTVEVAGRSVRVDRPANPVDVSYVRVAAPPIESEGDFYVVLVRKRGVAGWLARLFRPGSLTVTEVDDVD